MAPHSSTLAWKIPWTEKPGGLQSMGLLRVGHDWVTSLSFFTFMHWRRKWQPTPVFLPGEPQGQGSLMGCRLWGCRVRYNWSDSAAAAAAAAAAALNLYIALHSLIIFMILTLYLSICLCHLWFLSLVSCSLGLLSLQVGLFLSILLLLLQWWMG